MTKKHFINREVHKLYINRLLEKYKSFHVFKRDRVQDRYNNYISQFILVYSWISLLLCAVCYHYVNNKIIFNISTNFLIIHLNRQSSKYKQHIPYTIISLSLWAFELYIMANFFVLNWILHDINRNPSDPVDHPFS